MDRPKYWEQVTDGAGNWRRQQRPPGEDLAAMRQGADREPGTVPAMWPHHAVPIDEDWLDHHRPTWSVPPKFEAEHHALTLYGFHQQSLAEPMHRHAIGLGSAMLRFRQSGRASEQAVDRRFTAAATATDAHELAQHLRRLIALLRGARQPLDYTRLFHDLAAYQLPEWQGRVRRRWGLQYYTSRTRDRAEHDSDTAEADDLQPEPRPQ